MTHIFLYEWRKVWRRRKLIIIIAVMALLSAVTSYMTEHAAKPENYQEQHDKTVDNIIYESKINLRYIDDKESTEALYQTEVGEHYDALYGRDVTGEVRGFDTVLETSLPYMASLAVMILVSFFSASADIDDDGDLVMRTFVNKRSIIAGVKLCVLAFSSVMVTVILTASSLLGASLRNGIDRITEPVGAIPNYIRCPYDITVAEAILIRVAVSILVCIEAAVIIATATVLLRRIVSVAVFAITLIAADLMVTQFSGIVTSFFYNSNLTGSLSDAWLTRYSGVRIGGGIVPRPIFAVCVFVIVTAVASALFVMAMTRFRTAREHGARRKMQKTTLSDTHGLWFYEIKKALTVRSICVTVFMLALSCVIVILQNVPPTGAYNRVYNNFLTEMEPMTYEEQTEYVVAKSAEAYEIITEASTARDRLNAGEIEHDEYMKIRQRADATDLTLAVLDDIMDQLTAIKSADVGGNAALVYATGWRSWASNTSKGANYLLAIAVILLLAPYAAREVDSGYGRIIYASMSAKSRNRFELRKLAVMVICGTVIAMIFVAAELLIVHIRIGLPSWDRYAVGAGVTTHFASVRLWMMAVAHLAFTVTGVAIESIVLALLSRTKMRLAPMLLAAVVICAVCNLPALFGAV